MGDRPSPLSREHLPQNVEVEILLGQEALEAGVLFLECFEPFEFVALHTAVLTLPAVDRLVGDTEFSGGLSDGLTLSGQRFDSAQKLNDLLGRMLGLLHKAAVVAAQH